MQNKTKLLKDISLFTLFLLLTVINLFAAQPQEVPQDNPSADSQQEGAQKPEPPTGAKEMKAPPKFAIDVCTGKTAGGACQIETPRGTEQGVCDYTPDKKYFACKPNRPPMRDMDKDKGAAEQSKINETQDKPKSGLVEQERNAQD